MTRPTVPDDLRQVPLRVTAPTRGDRIAALASQVIGGPLGSRAVTGRGGWRPAAALLSALSSVFVALGVVQKNHCVSAGWATPGSLWRACYSDLPVAVGAPAGSSPWSSAATGNQPPLTAMITWFVRMLVPEGSQLRLQQGMFAWGAAVIAILIALTVTATAASIPRGPWAAAHVALSPVLITVSLLSFDALAIALVAGGLLAWRRGNQLLAGAALMAAFLTRPALGVVLAACVLVLVQRRRRVELRGLGAGSVACLLIVLGIVLVWGGDPFRSYLTWRDQSASYGSLWYVFSFAGLSFSPVALTAVACLGWAAAIAAGWFLVRSDARIGVEPVALLMLVIVMATSRALPVQAALWLLPLLALCMVPWRDHLIWAGIEVAYFALLWSFVARDSNMAKALPEGWFAALTGVRLLGLFFIARAGIAASGDDEPGPVPTTSRMARLPWRSRRPNSQNSADPSETGSL